KLLEGEMPPHSAPRGSRGRVRPAATPCQPLLSFFPIPREVFGAGVESQEWRGGHRPRPRDYHSGAGNPGQQGPPGHHGAGTDERLPRRGLGAAEGAPRRRAGGRGSRFPGGTVLARRRVPGAVMKNDANIVEAMAEITRPWEGPLLHFS